MPAPPPVSRLVTLAPNLTEIVLALGDGAKVVGADDFSTGLPAAVARVGGVQPNAERIVSLRPDLVLATPTGNIPALERTLAAAHVRLVVIRTDRLADIPPAMQQIGMLLHNPRTAAAVAQLQRDIAAQRRTRARRPRVLFVVLTSPLYVAGRNSFIDDLFRLTGVENAVEVEGWPQVSIEPVLAHPPDLVLHPDQSVTPRQLDALFDAAPEVRRRTLAVDENLFTHPGPRVAEAARRLNAILDAWDAAH